MEKSSAPFSLGGKCEVVFQSEVMPLFQMILELWFSNAQEVFLFVDF